MPVKKTDREQWVRAGLSVLDGARIPGFVGRGGVPVQDVTRVGRYLFEVSLDELCALVAEISGHKTLSKGSFYNHFPDGLVGLTEAVIGAFVAEREETLVTSHVTVLQDPFQVLQVMRSNAERTAVRDRAMGRWADAAYAGEEGGAAARDALEVSNAKILDVLTAALVNMGLAPATRPARRRALQDGMAETQAKLLAADFGCGLGTMTVAPGDENGFANLLRGLADMAAAEKSRQRGGQDKRVDVSSVTSDGKQTTIFVVTAQAVDPAEVQAAVAALVDRIEAGDAVAAEGRVHS